MSRNLNIPVLEEPKKSIVKFNDTRDSYLPEKNLKDNKEYNEVSVKSVDLKVERGIEQKIGRDNINVDKSMFGDDYYTVNPIVSKKNFMIGNKNPVKIKKERSKLGNTNQNI